MATQVHGDDKVPFLVGHVEQHPVSGDPGVVDHDVQSAQSVGTGDEFVGSRTLADVTWNRDGLGTPSTGGRDLVDDVGGIQGGGQVVDDDRGAEPRQAERLGAAKPRGRTGNHRDLSGQIGRVRAASQFMNTSSFGSRAAKRGLIAAQ